MDKIKKIIRNQREFYMSGKTKSYEFRSHQLKKIRLMIENNEKEINNALKMDLGKSKFESYISEIGYIYDSIDFTLKHLKKWMSPEKVKTSLTKNFGITHKIYKDSLGQVLIMAPFNYPFQLVFEPLIGAIAAGNTCIIKPSEYSSNTSKLIKNMIEMNFSDKVIRVILGGKETSQELLEESFDHIFFTGSSKVGKIIMKKASENLTPVTLELGGKSPCIVDKNIDLKNAAKKIIWGKFLNAGQTCIAPDYLVVHREIKEEFLIYLEKSIIDFYGSNIKESADYGRIINEKHYKRLKNLIDSKKILFGGHTSLDDLYIEPTLLDDIDWDDLIMEEEIFGPILPIISYESLDEIVYKIRNRPKPLSLYLFSDNKAVQEVIINNISFGGGCINNTIMHVNSNKTPFGGVGKSGIGKYHGKYSFKTFSHEKVIAKSKSNVISKIIFPPYSKAKLKIIKKILK